MRILPGICLSDIQQVYSGSEGRLWELIMGEQIHIGGLRSSLDLAERAGIAPGGRGVDLCCATGAGMRFLLRFRQVAHMTGVDATPFMIGLGQQRAVRVGLGERIRFVEADVCRTGLPDKSADFVWGEDAWCYVRDKSSLIAEAARLVKPGGRIAFTDWVEGEVSLNDEEARRLMTFMKFPSLFTLADYRESLLNRGCTVATALDTRRFAGFVQLYIDMIERQLTFDALQIIGFDDSLANTLLGEMRFMEGLARAGKLCQGLIVAERRS